MNTLFRTYKEMMTVELEGNLSYKYIENYITKHKPLGLLQLFDSYSGKIIWEKLYEPQDYGLEPFNFSCNGYYLANPIEINRFNYNSSTLAHFFETNGDEHEYITEESILTANYSGCIVAEFLSYGTDPYLGEFVIRVSPYWGSVNDNCEWHLDLKNYLLVDLDEKGLKGSLNLSTMESTPVKAKCYFDEMRIINK